MLGWGRKAVRITLPVKATKEQIAAVESLCAMIAPATPAVSTK